MRCVSHSDRTPSLHLSDGPDGRLLVRCFAGCEQAAVLKALRTYQAGDVETQTSNNSTLPPSRKDIDRERAAAAVAIWQVSRPATGTLVAAYLGSRCITINPPSAIRFHSGLRHAPSGQTLPAMVAGIQSPSGDLAGIHRTFLALDGFGKAHVEPQRMMLGTGHGGAVRITPAAETLALVEGVEDALALVQLTRTPCWAVVGVAGFRNVVLPPTVRTVILGPDNDEAGQAVIQPAGQRFIAQGLAVQVARPPWGAKDWNAALELYEERAAIAEHEGKVAPDSVDLVARKGWC